MAAVIDITTRNQTSQSLGEIARDFDELERASESLNKETEKGVKEERKRGDAIDDTADAQDRSIGLLREIVDLQQEATQAAKHTASEIDKLEDGYRAAVPHARELADKIDQIGEQSQQTSKKLSFVDFQAKLNLATQGVTALMGGLQALADKGNPSAKKAMEAVEKLTESVFKLADTKLVRGLIDTVTMGIGAIDKLVQGIGSGLEFVLGKAEKVTDKLQEEAFARIEKKRWEDELKRDKEAAALKTRDRDAETEIGRVRKDVDRDVAAQKEASRLMEITSLQEIQREIDKEETRLKRLVAQGDIRVDQIQEESEKLKILLARHREIGDELARQIQAQRDAERDAPIRERAERERLFAEQMRMLAEDVRREQEEQRLADLESAKKAAEAKAKAAIEAEKARVEAIKQLLLEEQQAREGKKGGLGAIQGQISQKDMINQIRENRAKEAGQDFIRENKAAIEASRGGQDPQAYAKLKREFEKRQAEARQQAFRDLRAGRVGEEEIVKAQNQLTNKVIDGLQETGKIAPEVIKGFREAANQIGQMQEQQAQQRAQLQQVIESLQQQGQRSKAQVGRHRGA